MTWLNRQKMHYLVVVGLLALPAVAPAGLIEPTPGVATDATAQWPGASRTDPHSSATQCQSEALLADGGDVVEGRSQAATLSPIGAHAHVGGAGGGAGPLIAQGSATRVEQWQIAGANPGDPVTAELTVRFSGLLLPHDAGSALASASAEGVLNVYDLSFNLLAAYRGWAWAESDGGAFAFGDHGDWDGLLAEYTDPAGGWTGCRLPEGTEGQVTFDAVVGGEYVVELKLFVEAAAGGFAGVDATADFTNGGDFEFSGAYDPLTGDPLTGVGFEHVPEPSTALLVGLGGVGLLVRRRRREA